MKALKGFTRVAFLVFFSSHIAVTLVIDFQAIAPREWVPTVFADLLHWYASNLNDPLMSNPQELPWFQSLVALEVIFQVPFFFWAVSTLLATAHHHQGK